MSTFCPSCGAATGGGKFCPKCGSPQGDGAPAASLSQAPYAPAPKKSPVLKVVLITLGVLFLLGVAGAVKVYFVVRDGVREARQELAKSKMGSAERTQPGCDLLGKDEVSQILHTPVVRVKGNQAGELREFCNYYSQANAPSDEDKNADADTDKSAESKDGGPGLKDLGSIAKKISDASRHRPLLSAQIYRGNAAAALIGIKTVSRLSGNSEPSIPGPWDEAYFGPQNTTFVIRKGSNGVLLDLTQVEKKREAGLAIAKAMAPSL
jgi:hypothetical protein